MPCGPLLLIGNRLGNFIFTWSDCVLLDPCMQFFSVLLFHQFTIIVFFVSKNIVMGRDGRWVLHAIPLNLLLPIWLRSSIVIYSLWIYPITFTNILSRPRCMTLLLTLFILEPVHPGGKTIGWFDDSYAELLQPVHAQVLRTLHAFAYLFESSSCLIRTRTYTLSQYYYYQIFFSC